MKYLKVLMFILGLILFAVIFIFLGIYLAYNTERDMIIQDYEIPTIIMNVGTGDRSVNQLPTLDTLALTFPQEIGFDRIFDCSSTSNLTVKVTAINPNDPDGNISRLKFYYYNVDDPDRILDYKETWIISPYTYFVVPKMGGEYRFGVILYDNNGGIVNSEDIIGKGPVLYIPASCGYEDVPTVTLKVSSTNVQVGDTVSYSVVSKISSDNEDFQTDRTFYYDFTGDGIWDLVTKKDSVIYTFEETYEDGVTPRAAVEYRGKLGQGEGATILVKNGIKPILLYNSIGNTVIFRDLSVGVMQEREICFEKSECEAGNKKFNKISISTVDPNEMNPSTETPITEKDHFLQKYEDYGTHKVSIYFKNKYGIEAEKEYDVKTSSNTNNGKIAPGVNMITIPETTFNNTNPEIFLSKVMNNSLLMYINNENEGACYVDTDISIDSDGDGKTDNDMDVLCNKMVKIVYEPNYESSIGRLYFTNNGQLTFKNFYVTFEGSILELDEEKLEIYNDISSLINSIVDICIENVDLKESLDKLRKNLNNRAEITELFIIINEQLYEGGIKIDIKQKELLDSILNRVSNEDIVVLVGMNEYEKNREEILASLPRQGTIKATVEEMFQDFNEMAYQYKPEEKAKELNKIWNTIIKDGKKNKWMFNENDFTSYFCNIFNYYEINYYTDKC